MKKYPIILIMTILFSAGCENKSTKEIVTKETNDKEKIETEPRFFTKKQIAKATIAGIMGRSLKIIEVKESDDICYVSYFRQDDKQLFKYKVKVGAKKVIWGDPGGRWRVHKLDEKITYTETKDTLVIFESYGDGSHSTYAFSLEDMHGEIHTN